MNSGKLRYDRLKAEGICTICGFREARKNRVHCDSCTSRVLARNKKYHEENYATIEANRLKKRREREEQGICIYCGREKASEGWLQCSTCRQKKREAFKIKREQKKEEDKLNAINTVVVVRCKECAYVKECKSGQFLGLEGYCSNGEKI